MLLVMVKAAVVEPNLTPVAPVKPVPVMVTVVPPAVVPEVGLMPVTVGAGGGVPPEATRSTATPEEVPAGDCLALGATAPETVGVEGGDVAGRGGVVGEARGGAGRGGVGHLAVGEVELT